MASVSLPASSNGTQSQYSEECRTQFGNLRSQFRRVFDSRLIGPPDNPTQRFLQTDEASFQLNKGSDDLKQLYGLTRGNVDPPHRGARKTTKPAAKKNPQRAAKRRRIELPTPQPSAEATPENDAVQEVDADGNDEKDVEKESETFAEAVLGQEMEDGVIRNAKVKIVAILMRIGVQVDSEPWQNFVRHAMDKDDTLSKRLCDNALPFSIANINRYFGSDELLNAAFFYQQYPMCAPVIKKKRDRQAFPENTVWPFEQVKELTSLSGRKRGTLSKVKVAPGHCEVETNNGWLFKKDLDNNARDADMARQLAGNRHKHDNVIETRAIVEQAGKTSILMECGDGTLHDLMSGADLSGTRFSNGSGCDEKIDLFRKQIDVGKALALFHHGLENLDVPGEKLLGIHGDYGARNVLVVKTSAKSFILKLSDYGISSLLRPNASETGQKPGRTQGDQCECIPPEGLELIHPDNRPDISEKYDVWAFACVLLMYITWLWNGKDGYNDFRDKRLVPRSPLARQPENERFFEIIGPSQTSNDKEFTAWLRTEDGDERATFRINTAVVQFFEKIRDSKNHPRESKFYWNIFEVLREVALLPDPSKRMSMAVVCERLEQVIQESKALQQ